MPGGAALPEQYIQCVADWITSLSPNGCETCGGTDCVSLASDANHCGSCGTTCPPNSTCQSGTCVCSSGQQACGSVCADTNHDVMHCGGCDNVCPVGSSCNDGRCACSGSLAMCGSSCIDLASDAAHCGGCGQACGSGQVCLSGACSSGCGELTQCGASCIDLKTSPAHCGSCDSVCASGLSCVDGACSCPAGQELCGTNCVDLSDDANHCGACGIACGPGSTCSEGSCRCGTTTVSFQNDVQPIFTASCNNAGCHSGARPKEGLSLESGKAHAALVGVASTQCSQPLVTAGNVAQSYLMDKLLGVDLCSGSQMPKAGQSLPAAEIALISDWICQGANAN
jgi:hypothetical protein